jgi:hypothetical protein
MEIKNLKPVMPKEHGLWVWVFLPLFVGAFSVKGEIGGFCLLLGMAFFGFMALTPARITYKNRKKGISTPFNIIFWSVAYFAVSVFFAVALAVKAPSFIPWYLLMAAGFYAGVRAFHEGYSHSAWFEYAGLILLSLGSLAGSYLVSGKITDQYFGVWVCTLLFLLDRTTQSRRVVRLGGFQLVLSGQFPKIAQAVKPVFRLNLTLSFLTILIALSTIDWFRLHPVMATPFIPGFFLTLYFYLRLPTTLKHIGYAELFLAILYGAMFSILARIYV